MISLIRNIVFMLGKRGELRNKDILLTPQLSSSFRMLEFLSSCVLLFKKLIIVMPRFGTNRQAIFELGKNKIGRSLEFFATQKIGMTVLMVVFSLFLLFPFSSKAGIYFLPDAQNEEISNTLSTPPVVSIDSVRCEEIGYSYYSSGVCPAYHNQEVCVFSDKYLKCDAEGWCRNNSYTISSCSSPKVVDTQCPNNFALYKYCVCPSEYKYVCTGTGYSSGNGTVCESKYTKCNCSTNYVWNGSACVCDSSFKYSCSGTGYSSGSGVSCGGKYKSCNCSTYYNWNGSACVHTHSYTCPSGYKTSSSGMISPVTTSKVCQLSGCSSTSGTCYKEGHTHSYSCPSGSYSSSSSCSYGTSGTTSKKCSCGATSGTCYVCASAPAHTHDYTCPYSWYTFSYDSEPCRYGYSDVKDATCSSCGDILDDVCYNCYSICDVDPCTSGCYDDLDCSHGCASTNSCGGCDECVVPPCPETICTILGGTYSGGSCSVDCSSRYCDRPCTCESQYGAELIDGYCTKTCGNVCIAPGGLD